MKLLTNKLLLASAVVSTLLGLSWLPQAIPQPAGMCGNWQEQWAQTQRDMLSGKRPGYYLVFFGGGSGLADTLSGLGTAALMALLMGRGLLLDHMGSDYAWQWEWGFQPNQLDWSLANKTTETKNRWKALCESNIPVDRKRYVRRGNLTEVYGPRGRQCVLLGGNSGNIFFLFQNPSHRQQLYEWGLRPETAFGCLINFLLKPVPEVFSENTEIIQRLAAPNPMKIGIQIRTGDKWWLRPEGPNTTMFEGYFRCAQSLEEAFLLPNQEVIWYLVSDSAELRKHAVKTYGSKVLTTINDKIQHVIKGFKGFNNSGGPDVLRQAVADNWFFSMVDYFVVSFGSGFGRTAYFRSLKSQGAYSVAPEDNRICERGTYDFHDNLARLGTRI